jgi:hypothetical protein
MYAMRILRWLAFSARPLSVREVAGERSDPAQRIIALAHYSVQEYLVSDRIKQGLAKQYNMHEAKCHGVMMDGCSNYLLQLRRLLSEEVIQTSALARYAAEF